MLFAELGMFIFDAILVIRLDASVMWNGVPCERSMWGSVMACHMIK